MTSVHNSEDARIFHKQCVSLAKSGYEVFLIAPGNNYKKNGVNIIGVGEKPDGKLKRILLFTRKVYKKAKSLNADIYHIHDPELLLYGLILKKQGKKVIFDSHEDYLLTITEKSWIPSLFRKITSKLFEIYESKIIKAIDGAIVCYPWTEERYRNLNRNVKMVLNFPILKEKNIEIKYKTSRKIAFAGGISKQWSHKEIIEALTILKNVQYELAGKLIGNYGKELKSMGGWQYVNYHGVIPFEEVKTKIYERSSIGMVLLDYIAQCKGTVGNLSNTKFFEYMQMGLPLVCTNFDLWKEIIDEEECGIYVNPHDVNEIVNAINFLLDNPNIAKTMGENGRKAIINKYNWNSEEKKLIELYKTILN